MLNKQNEQFNVWDYCVSSHEDTSVSNYCELFVSFSFDYSPSVESKHNNNNNNKNNGNNNIIFNNKIAPIIALILLTLAITIIIVKTIYY